MKFNIPFAAFDRLTVEENDDGVEELEANFPSSASSASSSVKSLILIVDTIRFSFSILQKLRKK